MSPFDLIFVPGPEGTEKSNRDNGLGLFLAFVPMSPQKNVDREETVLDRGEIMLYESCCMSINQGSFLEGTEAGNSNRVRGLFRDAAKGVAWH
ncbi:MAG: hypothetical protein JSR49_11420 [Proteobacteria bacterium]|nr:hypothetical protein [Pseudomonadota bacterium]